MAKKFFIFIILILGAYYSFNYFENNFFKNNREFVKRLPIQNIEIAKYLGTWYEIARYPNWFEKDLVGVTAIYSLKDNNHIKVLNQGYVKILNGKRKQIVGDAWMPNKQKKGSLKVSFFKPFSAGYYIVAIDKDYQYALVLSDSPNYLWILSRKPILNEAIYNKLIALAKNLGVDVSQVVKIPQQEDK